LDLVGLRALVAEDEAINRMFLTRVLESAGLAVVAVKDGEAAAAAALEAERPHFVLMDVTMPRLSGTDAVLRIRAEESARSLPRLPVIALTAHGRPEDRASYAEAGMDGFVSKPLSEGALWKEVRRVLAERT